MPTAIHRYVQAARDQKLDRVIRRMASGWAVMGETQVMHGYCLLLPDPVVPHLNALVGQGRVQFLTDMATLGDAVLKATNAIRINYEMLGNLEPALHAHVLPRYEDESEDLRTKPIWFYDWNLAPKFDAKADAALMAKIRGYLQQESRT